MLDKFRETAITWDKANRKVYEPLRVSAGDNKGRKLSVQVVNGGVIESLSGASLSLFWETKDKAHKGLDAFTAVDATKGEFEIYYTTGMLSNEGTLNANLVLVDASGRIVSEPFTIAVFKGIDDDAIQSSDSFTALTEALVQVGTINNKADRAELLALESTFEQNKVSVEQQLQQTASQTELETQKSRIDNLSSLEEGSTTGDAELIDMKVGALGHVYGNSGSALREQIKNAIAANKSAQTYPIVKDQYGTQLVLRREFYKGQTIEFSLSDPSGIINSASFVIFGVTGTDGIGIDNISRIKTGELGTYLLPKNCKEIRCWIESSAKVSSGNVVLNVAHKKNVYESFNEIKNETDGYANMIFGDVIPKKTVDELTYRVNIGTDIYSTYATSYKKGQRVYLKLDSANKIKADSSVSIGIQYSDRYHENAIRLTPNNEIGYTFENDVTQLIFWAGRTAVLESGDVRFLFKNYSEQGLNGELKKTNAEIDTIKERLSVGKNFSILSDSNSTYKGWLPDGYASWYADDGNVEMNDVADVKDTWWWQFSRDTKMSLLVNSSYSGSTMANRGYDGNDSSATSFITRMKRDLGEGRSTNVKPDVIFIFGATNDEWAGTPLGQLKYFGWTETDLNNVLPAFCYTVDYLITRNPNARIINVVNTGLSPALSQGMQAACDHYGIENIVLTDVSKDSGHPNKAGMISIKNQVVNKFRN